MERVWNKFSGQIEGFLHNRRLKRYFKTAEKMKPRIESFLQEKGLKYSIRVLDDSEEYWWSKVKIEVQLNIEDFAVVLKLWEEIDNVAYRNLSTDDIKGVFISVD